MRLRLVAVLAAATVAVVVAQFAGPGSAAVAAPTRMVNPTLTATRAFTASAPMQIVGRPGTTDAFVAQRAGTVLRVVGSVPRKMPYLTLTGLSTTGEGGLDGIAFDRTGSWLYTYSTLARSDGGLNIQIRAHKAATTAAASGGRLILTIAHPKRAHHISGAMAVGPDGDLWIATGDSGGSFDPDNRAVDVHYLLGKLIRITPTPGRDVTVLDPALNPWGGGPRCSGRSTASSAACPEIWAYGLRNPFRMSFDPATGDLWLPDVGQDTVEEVNFVPPNAYAGRFFGWPYVEGDLRLKPGGPANPVAPLYTYRHAGLGTVRTGCAVVGGVAYTGSGISGLNGAYVNGDYCHTQLYAVRRSGGKLAGAAGLGARVKDLVSIGQDGAGTRWAVSNDGPVYRLTS